VTRVRASDPGHDLARTLAALVGSGPVALAVSIGCVHVLPMPFEWRLLVGSYAAVPIWIALAWRAFLARSGRRAWAGLGLVFAASLVAIALGRGAP
jgi:hypothetical protein